MKKGILAIEDGVWFEGEGFGADGETFGEVVFHTGLSGYQEILTDPSYKGQMACMTYSHIGNYGINTSDVESCKPWVEGFQHKKYPIFCVQYHPENAPGPHDSDYLFTRFCELIEKGQKNA